MAGFCCRSASCTRKCIKARLPHPSTPAWLTVPPSSRLESPPRSKITLQVRLPLPVRSLAPQGLALKSQVCPPLTIVKAQGGVEQGCHLHAVNCLRRGDWLGEMVIPCTGNPVIGGGVQNTQTQSGAGQQQHSGLSHGQVAGIVIVRPH